MIFVFAIAFGIQLLVALIALVFERGVDSRFEDDSSVTAASSLCARDIEACTVWSLAAGYSVRLERGHEEFCSPGSDRIFGTDLLIDSRRGTITMRIRRIMRTLGVSMLYCLPATAGIVIGGPPDPFGNLVPFGGPGVVEPGTRYQQAYAKGDFSGPILVTGIDFFVASNANLNDCCLYAGMYQLSLSTITAGIDTLSDINFGLMAAEQQSDESKHQQEKDWHVSDFFQASPSPSTGYERIQYWRAQGKSLGGRAPQQSYL
jgi:hypothetical protein